MLTLAKFHQNNDIYFLFICCIKCHLIYKNKRFSKRLKDSLSVFKNHSRGPELCYVVNFGPIQIVLKQFFKMIKSLEAAIYPIFIWNISYIYVRIEKFHQIIIKLSSNHLHFFSYILHKMPHYPRTKFFNDRKLHSQFSKTILQELYITQSATLSTHKMLCA